MGEPIKDRGIRWVETYGDKSEYLKREMEQQVGPGSYFRWEGHDSTTSTDYYVVVSPGFSKKKGYHFFAGLRKMPADQGASGHKFPSQAEALGYAMDTWGVPPGQTKPMKPYNVQDIAGKDIVLEGNKAQPKASTRKHIIVAGTSKGGATKGPDATASLHHTAKHSDWYRTRGPQSYKGDFEWFLKASLAMGDAAAWTSVAEFIGMDAYGQHAKTVGYDHLKGRMDTLPITSKMSTSESPDKAAFEAAMKRVVPQHDKLYEVSKQGKRKKYVIQNPQHAKPVPGKYEHTTFADVANIHASISVPQAKHEQFKQALEQFHATKSGLTGSPPSMRLFDDPESQKKRDAGKNVDYTYTGTIPVDVMDAMKAHLDKTQLGHVHVPKFYQDTAAALYSAAKNGNVETADGRKLTPQEMISNRTPVYQVFYRQGVSDLMKYDGAGMPLGIRLGRRGNGPKFAEDPKLGMLIEKGEKGDDAAKDVTWKLEDGVRKQLLAKAGSPERLAAMIENNEIQFTPEMFKDVATLVPKLAPIYTESLKTDEIGRPQGGQVNVAMQNKVPPAYADAAEVAGPDGRPTKVVRVFNSKEGRNELRPIPPDQVPKDGSNAVPWRAAGNKPVNGAPLITEGAYMRYKHPDGRVYQIKTGEWKHYDDAPGKMVPDGDVMRVMLRPAWMSAKGTDAKMVHELGLARKSFVAMKSEVNSTMEWQQGPPRPGDRRVVDVVQDASGKIIMHAVAGMRQKNPSPITSARPKKDRPVNWPRHEKDKETGEVRPVMGPNGQPMTRAVTSDQAEFMNDAFGTVWHDSGVAMAWLKDMLALDDESVGPFTPLNSAGVENIDHLWRETMLAFDSVKAGKMPETSLTKKQLRAYNYFHKGDSQMALQDLMSMESDPNAFKSERGNFWSVKEAGTNPPVWHAETPKMFPSLGNQPPQAATSFMESLQAAAPGKSFEVAMVSQGAPFVSNSLSADNPDADLAINVGMFREEAAVADEQAQPQQPPAAPEPAPAPDPAPPAAEAPPAPPAEPDIPDEFLMMPPSTPAEPEVAPTPAPAPAAAPAAPPPAPAPAPQGDKLYQDVSMWASNRLNAKHLNNPNVPLPVQLLNKGADPAALNAAWTRARQERLQKVAPPPPSQKIRPGGPSAPTQADVIKRMVALAERLDSQGRTKEADAVDKVIQAALARSR